MSGVGLTWFLGALGESNHSIPYSIGQVVWAIPLAFFIHALLVFPRGYLETRLVYVTVVAAYGTLGIGPALFSVFGEVGGKDVPRNAFVVFDSNTAVDVVGLLFIAFGLFICGSTIWVLVRRWRGKFCSEGMSSRA